MPRSLPALEHKLSAWLEANSGPGKRMRKQPPKERVTRAAWFQREHDVLGLVAAVWVGTAVLTWFDVRQVPL